MHTCTLVCMTEINDKLLNKDLSNSDKGTKVAKLRDIGDEG